MNSPDPSISYTSFFLNWEHKITTAMADRSTPSTTTVSTSNAAAEKKAKPEKPDEDAFKANLAMAEKEHAAAMERLVCHFLQMEFSYVAYGVLRQAYCTPQTSKYLRGGSGSLLR